ncbi:MAG: dihydrolipoyl dehydrogenase family protein [Bacteroidota bacterium]
MATTYDIVVIGAGSGGLGVSLFAARVGLSTLLIDRSDEHIGGDCLNFGCVPSKALIHVSRIVNDAKKAERFGFTVSGQVDIVKVNAYISQRQSIIRDHENASFLRNTGMDVVLGEASFTSITSVMVNGKEYAGKKIVLASGSRPAPLAVPGAELVRQYNNESVFDLKDLPKKVLVVGGGPVGIEISQALSQLGSEVTVVHRRKNILPHDEPDLTRILLSRLESEGIKFQLEAEVQEFTSSSSAIIKTGSTLKRETFDAVFVATGRNITVDNLKLENAGVKVDRGKIVVNKYLQTTNKNILVCGDVAGSLLFSHAAEQHARILINNLFSPIKKKLINDHMSWVTFTDPEVATFGLSEASLKENNIAYEKVVYDFKDDDRAVIDDYRYGKLILFLSKASLLRKQKILGGAMTCPGAGELVQELILAMREGLSVNALFNKIYPYPVASRVNQLAIVSHKEKQLTEPLKKLLRILFAIFN